MEHGGTAHFRDDLPVYRKKEITVRGGGHGLSRRMVCQADDIRAGPHLGPGEGDGDLFEHVQRAPGSVEIQDGGHEEVLQSKHMVGQSPGSHDLSHDDHALSKALAQQT